MLAHCGESRRFGLANRLPRKELRAATPLTVLTNSRAARTDAHGREARPGVLHCARRQRSRSTNKLTWDEILRLYRLTMKVPPHNLPTRYNICPTDPVDVVTEFAKAIVTSSACGGARVVVVAKALQDLRAATRQAERPTVDSALPGTLKGCYYSRQCGEAAMRMKFIGYAGDFTSSARGERADNGADGRGSMRPIFGHAAGAAREVFRMDERLVQLPDQDAMDRLHPVPAKHRERESLVRTIPQ